ncbi:hypothetical protein PoB_001842600 [Plakobranchus ocellatus]|uniref:Uncharacterized protein n=1 Tax=Plakobranchus ocellatus TaxID=259542 RepID=A0AAV3Z7R6_9GAST|nr:hypothetical protein PoB_001842600 [Plakobranchus ocellatus]
MHPPDGPHGRDGITGDLRLSGPPSGQGAGSGARTHHRRVPADLRVDSQATVLQTPPSTEMRFRLEVLLALRKCYDKYLGHPKLCDDSIQQSLVERPSALISPKLDDFPWPRDPVIDWYQVA